MTRRAMRAAAVVAAAAVVWLAAAELAWPARALTAFLLSVLPVLMVAQLDVAAEVPGLVPRIPVYLSSAGAIWLLAAFAVGASLMSGFTGRVLGLIALPPVHLTVWSVGTTLAGFGLLVVARALRVHESPLLAYLLPRTAGERAVFVLLALSAGIGEELVFRSFLIPAVGAASGSVWFAAVLSAGVFGMLHTYQGTAGVVRAGALGLVLAVPFLVTGSVLPSIVAHAVLDLVGGLWLADWLLRR